MTTHDTAGTARGEMTMDDETTRLRALLRESTELALRLSERVKRAERERDDLAATLETRTAEHARVALEMERAPQRTPKRPTKARRTGKAKGRANR